ncbi:MAG: hypothetical protein NC320_07795 [Clostridium sp.]|nr:hypothetical protein [Clostridium sp.]
MRLWQDLKAFSQGSYKKAIVTILINPNFHCVCLYRLSSFLYKIHLSIISKLIWYLNRIIFNADIDYRCDLAGGFRLVHGLGVVIGRSVKTKGKVTVYQGVTLGGSGKVRIIDGKSTGQPIIGNNVIIYTDAKIFGPVIIGDNNKIKAGLIISSDIPDLT